MTQPNTNFFKQRQHQADPLIVSNIWDAASAKIVEFSGAEALATSSAAVAWSLGYADGSNIPVNLHLEAIKRIRGATTIPLTVDIENGYSNKPENVAELAHALVDIGVQGINIEDGKDSPELLIQKIRTIKSAVGKLLFVNARTDTYLHSIVAEEQRLKETQARLKRYEESGADGIFIPGLNSRDIVEQLHTSLPINLMIKNVTEIQNLKDCKVSRFSFGPTPFLEVYGSLSIHCGLSPYSAENKALDFETMNNL